MTPLSPLPQAEAEAALASLERLLAERPEEFAEEIPEAVRRLVSLRDRLISTRRTGTASAQQLEWLTRVNAILSCVVAAEFPIRGLHRERVDTARQALRQLLASI